MAKLIFRTLILIFLAISYASDGYPAPDRLKDRMEAMKEKRNELKEILARYDKWEVQPLLMEFDYFEKAFDKLKGIYRRTDDADTIDPLIRQFNQVYELALESYHRIIFADEVIHAMRNQENAWENEYFRLWERINYLKKRIDNLYLMKEKVSKNNFGGFTREKTKARKRNLYYPAMEYYENKLVQMKRLDDYYSRIPIEEKLVKLFEKMDELFLARTRDLEKTLRKMDDPEKVYTTIIEYSP